MRRRLKKPERTPDFVVGGQEFFIGEMIAYNNIHEITIKIGIFNGRLVNNYAGYPRATDGWYYYHNPKVDEVFHEKMAEIEKILLGS